MRLDLELCKVEGKVLAKLPGVPADEAADEGAN